jgi:hypothetical protein
MQHIFDLEPGIAIPAANSYILSYPHLVSYFASRPAITPDEVVQGAHMVYGWMPTVLELDMAAAKGASLQRIATLLGLAREGDLDGRQLGELKGMVNNSIVGASKLLHFVAPDRYPIWDSRIYEFCNGKAGHAYQVNKVDAYLNYRAALLALADDPRCAAFHASVNAKVGYAVSRLRALELMMFLAVRP